MKKILITVSAVACALTGVIAVACQKTEEFTYKLSTEGEITDVVLKKGETYTIPAPASRGVEWEFGGWYEKPNFSGAPVTSIVAGESEATTYYAKWTQLYKLTLNANGGTLSGANEVYIKSGTNLTQYLESYVPTKQGYQFGEWTTNGIATAPASMPAKACSLTARYKVGYTVDVYTQNLTYCEAEDKTGLEEFGKQTVTLYDYANANFDLLEEFSYEGFTGIDHEDNVLDGELKDNPSAGDNHFVIYMNRNKYTVTLNANNVDSIANAQTVSMQYYYGAEPELPYNLYSKEGYVFAGWSKNPSGKNDYKINYVEHELYNGNQSAPVVRDPYVVKNNETLFAYWNKGYYDMFGGSDTIFYLEQGSTDIYLYRGGKFFKGECNKKLEFTFNEDGETLYGKLLEGDAFRYEDTELQSTTVKYYSVQDGLKDNISLTFSTPDNRYNGVTYTEDDKTATGTYMYDNDRDEYTATFTGGTATDMVGKTIHFIKTTVSNSTSSYNVFVIRNEVEYGYGTIRRILIGPDASLNLYNGGYTITFGGYGLATYRVSESNASSYYCTYDEANDAYVLKTNRGVEFGTVKLVREGELFGYMLYEAELAQRAVTSEDGERLQLDGIKEASYFDKDGRLIASGRYVRYTSSYLGSNGFIVKLYTRSSVAYTFLFTSHTEEIEGKKVTVYNFERKPNGYEEFYYYDGSTNSQGSAAFYAPLLVLDDQEAGKASLYEYDGKEFVITAEGTYTYDTEENKGLFTITERTEDADHSMSKFNIDGVASFIFSVDRSLTSNRVYYIYSLEDLEEGETVKSEHYTDEKGTDAELYIVGGFAVLKEENNKGTITGTYQTNAAGITRITSSQGYVYLEINEGEGTFLRYDSLYGVARRYSEDGTTNSNETLTFNGKGGVTYALRELNEAGDGYDITEYVGTYEQKEDGVVTFTQTDGDRTFDFVMVSANGGVYFSIISNNSGTYNSDGNGTLVLDGSGFEATYTVDLKIYRGIYRAARTDGDTNIVYMYLQDEGGYLYFKLDSENRTFTLIGNEYGTYLVMDNSVLDGRVVMFDGEGNFVLSVMADRDDPEAINGLKKIAEGQYTKEDGLITLSYGVTLADTQVPTTVVGRTGTFVYNNNYYNTFFIHYDSIADTYVNEQDYSVLVLNDTGSATRYTNDGVVERGSYTLIVKADGDVNYSLFYYVSDNGNFAKIYKYDWNNKLVEAIENSNVAYYNSELSALAFTTYGFAIFNGTERYYYYKEDANTYALYRNATNADKEDPDIEVNEFGFVREELTVELKTIGGSTTNAIERDGVEYYEFKGQGISFTRVGDDTNAYPLSLSKNDATAKVNLRALRFTPSGGNEFNVSGKVTMEFVAGFDSVFQEIYEAINGKEQDCTVIKRRIAKDEEENAEEQADEYEIFIMVQNFRFDIDSITYSAVQSERTYSISRMRFYVEADSYMYARNLMMYSMLYGAQAAAQIVPFFGSITLWQDYDEQGDEQGDMLMSGTFGDVILCYDLNGKTISFDSAPCTVEKGVYTVTVDHSVEKGGDGHTYKGVFQFDSSLGVITYNLVSFYREQKFTSNGYEVTVGRTITSEDQDNAPGEIYTLSLAAVSAEEKTEIKADNVLPIKGDWYVIVRTVDEDSKLITSSVFYKVVLTEDMSELDSSGDSDSNTVKPVKCYKSATVEKIDTVATTYDEAGTNFVDMLGEEVLLVKYGRYIYFIQETIKNEDGTYSAMLSSGASFKITFDTVDETEVVTIELISAPTA